MNRKIKEITFSTILLFFSVIYIYSSLKLKMGSISNPGAGAYPLIIAFLLLVCSIIYFIQVLSKRKDAVEAEMKEIQTENYIPSFGIAASITAYPFLLNYFQFFLSTFIVTFSILMLLKYKRTLLSLVIALLMTFVAYVIFVTLLGVVLPFGEIERYISQLIQILYNQL